MMFARFTILFFLSSLSLFYFSRFSSHSTFFNFLFFYRASCPFSTSLIHHSVSPFFTSIQLIISFSPLFIFFTSLPHMLPRLFHIACISFSLFPPAFPQSAFPQFVTYSKPCHSLPNNCHYVAYHLLIVSSAVNDLARNAYVLSPLNDSLPIYNIHARLIFTTICACY